MSFQPPGGRHPPPPGGPPPPPPGNPYPPQGYPGPQQPWPQQQPWAPGPPPKKRGNGWKWGLGALALLVVIGVTAAVTISVTRGRRRWRSHADGRYLRFGKRRRQGPREHHHRRSQLRGVAPINGHWPISAERAGTTATRLYLPRTGHLNNVRSTTTLAERCVMQPTRSVQLAKLTPHRVMRELYEQFIAYARAYSDAIPTYTSIDNHLAGVALSSSGALTFACTAIEWGSAQAWAPLIPIPESPD